MQLPPKDEIVMVSGSPPIRASKVRYFEDAQLKARVAPVPDAENRTGPAGTDNWSGLAPILPPPGHFLEVSATETDDVQMSSDDLHDGRAREAGVMERGEVDVAGRQPDAADEFVFRDRRARGVDDEEAQRLRRLDRREFGLSRQAALDRGDGLGLDMEGQ